MANCFTLRDVAKHNTEADLWIVYGHKVYNVTPFVKRHPGGWKILVEHAGEDVTQLMSGMPHRHSQAAFKMLNDYYIGDLREVNGVQSKTSNGLTTSNTPVRHFALRNEERRI